MRKTNKESFAALEFLREKVINRFCVGLWKDEVIVKESGTNQ